MNCHLDFPASVSHDENWKSLREREFPRMPPLLKAVYARYRSLSWGQRGYGLVVLSAVLLFGLGGINHYRARSYERMHQRLEAAGARTTRGFITVDDPQESHFLAILGDFSGVALNGIIGTGSECNLDASIFRDLRTYRELRTLRLSQMVLKPADFQQIYELKGLSRLTLAYVPLTDADLAGIEKLEDLSSLELQFTPLTDAAIPRLAKLEGLVNLDLTGTDITADGVERLRQSYQKIQGTQATKVIHRPVPSPRFRPAVMRLLPTASYASEIRYAGNWSRLQLRPEGWKGHEQDIPLIAELTEVESVNVLSMPLTPELMTALSSLPKLQHFTLLDVPADHEDLSRLARCGQLKSLRLGGMQIDQEFSASLAKLKSLESLNVYNCKVSPGACQEIARIEKLQALHLRQIDVSKSELDDLLDSLEGSPHLRLLDLADVPIDNATVFRLARLKQLISLGLGAGDIDDGAVAELSTFTHLQQLDVTGTQISSLPGPQNLASGAMQLESALVPAGVRVVHSRSNTSVYAMNLTELADKAKADAAAAANAANGSKAVPGTVPVVEPKGEEPPPE